MKYIIKAKTFSGSMEFPIEAASREEAEREMAATLKGRGWEEVTNYPNYHQFRICKESSLHIHLDLED